MLSSQIYKEVSFDMGIDHHCYDPNMMGGGVAVFDFNNDGYDDIYLIGGLNADKLYENINGKNFKDVSNSMGITGALFNIKTMGVVAGDIDNDGFIDLLITTAENERCYLLRNNNGVSFEDISIGSGISHRAWSSTATMGDYDLDGDLDIYVGNYLNYSAIPFSENISYPEPNFFYQNNGKGQFIKIDNPLKNDEVGCTLVASFSDIDQDGDQDLFVLNDFGDFYESNKLLINNSTDNTFVEMANSSGTGIEINSMGIAHGDYDEDGDLDYYITNIGENFLFKKLDGINFKNVSAIKNVNDGTGFSWGTAFIDVNNDSYLDLYVAKGSILGQGNPPNQGNKLFIYDKESEDFKDRSVVEGIADRNRARGMAYGDFNNDGKQDFVVNNVRIEKSNSGNALLHINNGVFNNNWVKVILEGTSSNKSAYGSNVTLSSENRSWIKELSGGSSYLSSHSNTLHFGLADKESIDELIVSWPGNKKEIFTELQVNKTYKIIEGDGIYEYSLNYLELCEGENVFLQGEERTESGIYQDVINNTGQISKILITRLIFKSKDTCVDDPNDENGNTSKQSVARRWNELVLKSIRNDYARPTVHARNLFHTSIAMYDAFAAYEEEAKPYFLGNTVGNYTVSFSGINPPEDIKAAQEEAISYACFKLLNHRFKNSPNYYNILKQNYNSLMLDLGYDTSFSSVDYSTGNPAALGNYIGEQLIAFGQQDGANETNYYENIFYTPKNEPLVVNEPGNPTLTNPNNWQPLSLRNFIDQSGNIIGQNTPDFLSPEWGKVVPFALKENNLTKYSKSGNEFWVYHDPGVPVQIKSDGTLGLDDPYKWGFALVAIWSSHLDPYDGEMIDISPTSIGNTNISEFPKTFEDYKSFYNIIEGGLHGNGHTVNPITGQPYQPQLVRMGDYTRVLSEFWADGPDSETPPGHWFTILNYVNDHPLTEKKFNGKGDVLSDLEWDIKGYMALAGAMNDAAITAWGIKGYYDYVRPISAIRYMASKGQSSDTSLPNYNPEGIPLISGYIEIVQNDDSLSGIRNKNAGKIKLLAWKGSHFIVNPDTDVAGVDWILAENWVPYQRPSFVTPPFAGYVSGHSTFSRAAAEVLTKLTGSNFFPGGMGIFDVEKNEFLVFEDGPSINLTLQWATYQDAADQCSLSRIWGGIHPPIDDIAGRIIGETIGNDAFFQSINYFYEDRDGDGYYSFEDIDDNDKNVNEADAENKQFVYNLYPIPVKDELILSTPGFEGRLKLKIYNIHGENVMNIEVNMNNIEIKIPLQQLASGVYILVFTNQEREKLIAKKIIKQ